MSRALALLVLAAALPAQTKICPLGDSIVLSFGGMYTPRYHLDRLLTTNGYAFDFVGHNTGVYIGEPADPNFDQDHEAYPAQRVDMALPLLQPWIASTMPDIVLIHLGTNDIRIGQSAESTIGELGQCVDAIRAANPFATIMISQIIPMVARAVQPFNSLIPGLVAAKDSAASRVVMVDHYTPFDLATHMGSDGLHPNAAGELLMAQVWYAALLDYLTPAANQLVQFGAGCSGASATVPSLREIRGQAASLGNLFSIGIEAGPASALAFGIMGFDPVAYYGVPLPIDLGVVGATGCSLWVGPDVTFPLVNTGGEALWTIEVPDNLVLVGGTFYAQGAFLDAALNTLGLIVSDAAAVTVVAG